MPRLADAAAAGARGSVAIAGGLAAVYPSASPGGWRLLGRTTTALWDPDRDPPALLAPGMRVRFRPVSELPPVAPAHVGLSPAATSASSAADRRAAGPVR